MPIDRRSFLIALASAYAGSLGIPTLAQDADDRRLAEAYSRGVMACDALPEYEAMFAGLLESTCTLGGDAG